MNGWGALVQSPPQKSRAHRKDSHWQFGHLRIKKSAAFRPLLTEGLAFSAEKIILLLEVCVE